MRLAMASDTEGMAALISMYNDDEEEDDADELRPPSPPLPAAATSSSPSPRTEGENSNPHLNSAASSAPLSPPLAEDPAGRKTLASLYPSKGLPPLPLRRSSSPFAIMSPSPLRPATAVPPVDVPRPPRRGALSIVDYAHDETAMSPEQEDGEVVSSIGRLGSDAHVAEGNFEENTPSGTVHILIPNIRSEMSQQYNAPDQNQVGTAAAMSVAETETEDAQVEEAAANIQNDDPLSCFLPPPVTTKCSAALQQKINKFLAYKRAGKSFNSEVRNRKEYRNPDFLQHAVRYQEIDQIGTCFSKDVFDPYGYDRSDYYDEIEADMKREVERKELEKKKSGKVDFINGGVQATISVAIPKIAGKVHSNERCSDVLSFDKL
ncbi:hypothetical protein GUJ93_ZPchr0007g6029 [Zizania palustris]|uniref:Uncharacterized protein n=1 Tax=Zizania palustris TaxID=103762 RepID=A0A8J5TC70_ZIZPA|nr:hypothetical protein GUJ93_ZPchr0007g6029 [Zizania palustris]